MSPCQERFLSISQEQVVPKDFAEVSCKSRVNHHMFIWFLASHLGVSDAMDDELLRIPVRQMSGKVVVLEVTPGTTLREFKKQLEGWHPSEDELTRKMSTVDVIVGGEKLLEKDK